MSGFGPDVWLPTIRITADNNTFRLVEGSACAFTITPGTYLLHNDPNFDSNGSGLPGLYRAIADVCNVGAASAFYETHTGTLPSDTYDFEAVDPSIAPFIPYSGLRFGGGGTSFSIDFNHADFTMDPRWFGFTGGPAFSGLSGARWIVSPISVFGRWYSASLYDGEASRKHPIPFANVEYSSKRPGDSVAIPWEINKYRQFVYPFVQSGHIYDDRAANAEHATAAGLTHGDVHNAFESNVWKPLIQSEQILVMHDTGRASLLPSGTNFEIVKLAGRWDEFKPTKESYRGEFYRLDFRVWVNPNIGEYSF